MKYTVQTKALSKEYHVGANTIHAVQGVEFRVATGEFVAITGRSGSGKSTLLNLLAGLESPTGGEVVVYGEHLENMTESQRLRFRRGHVGFVFQSYNLLPQFSALENVALPLSLSGIPPGERNQKAREMLDLVGLSSHTAHKPAELSGGQQQRVGIARAIITKPHIVFADEPTGNLDSHTGQEIMELLTGIFREWGTTLLLVSHDSEMGCYTDREIRLLDGRITNIVSIFSGGGNRI